MRVYKLINHDSTGYLLSEDTVPRVFKDNELPRSIAAHWHDKEQDYQTDIVRLNGGWPNMAFSNQVKEQLEGSSQATGKWTEIHVNESILWLFHSTFVVDALDESRSDVRRLESGRVRDIKMHAFNPDSVPRNRLFMLKTQPYDLLCSDEFIDEVFKYNWKGFRFDPIWDNNLKPFPVRPNRKMLIARPEIYGPGGIVKGYENSWPDEWKK